MPARRNSGFNVFSGLGVRTLPLADNYLRIIIFKLSFSLPSVPAVVVGLNAVSVVVVVIVVVVVTVLASCVSACDSAVVRNLIFHFRLLGQNPELGNATLSTSRF